MESNNQKSLYVYIMASVAIVGSRNFFDDKKFCEEVDDAREKWGLKLSDIKIIISGGARGADTMAEEFAVVNGLPFKKFLPQWDFYGKAAGPIRNRAIIECAKHVLAFPSLIRSIGTQSAIKLAKKYKRELIVVYV